MTKYLAPLLLGFGVTMAVLIGRRMSTDAMAVIVGVAVGVAASVPASLLLVMLMRRDRRSYNRDPQTYPERPYPHYQQLQPPQQPQVIVLNAGDLMAGRGQQAFTPLPPAVGAEAGLRRLRVVGDDDDWGR